MWKASKWDDFGAHLLCSADDGGGAGSAPSSSGGGDGGGGGSPAPSSPASTDGGGGSVGGAAPAAPEPSGLDWSALGTGDDLDFTPTIPAEKPPLPTEPVVPPVVPPVLPPEPQPAQVPPAQEPTQPTTATPVQGDGAAQPRLTASDPWRIAEGLEAHRAEVIPHLAASKFALTEPELAELDGSPEVAIPKLLAKVFLESQISMQKFLAQAVPGMVKKYNTVSSANEGAEKKFFDMHKALDSSNPQHRATAVRIATLYRQANPGIPLDQLISEVGPMVMATLRIAPGGAPQAAGQPAIPRGGTPFRPAVNGGGGAPIASEPANEWAGLGTSYD
jgi:hypothetical protein